MTDTGYLQGLKFLHHNERVTGLLLNFASGGFWCNREDFCGGTVYPEDFSHYSVV